LVSKPKFDFRRSIRPPDYDYTQSGAYFITICVQGRICRFGEIVNGQVLLNMIGEMMPVEWEKLNERFPMLELDEFVIMPNHLHGIVHIKGKEPLDSHGRRPSISGSIKGEVCKPALGDIIGAFKSITTHEYISGVRELDWPRFKERLWQRSYYDHIIRNEKGLNEIREYIENNPLQWDLDQDNPKNVWFHRTSPSS
jgi:putative transposase